MAPTQTDEWCIVSAPGKVLVTGGYLVLDRAYTGTSLATDSRFYACLKPLPASSSTKECKVSVVSPQFDGTEWEFRVEEQEGDALLKVEPVNGKNPYLQYALLFALSLASSQPGFKQKLGNGLRIAVLGDNDFYSQADNLSKLGFPRTAEGLKKLDPFMPLGPLSGVKKTGLGSSAALVTSAVLCVLSYFGFELNEQGKEVGHATAQLAHCLAQGKVGSGFDVASAIYGSVVYRRFEPETVGRLIKLYEANELTRPELVTSLTKPWNHSHTPVTLPPGLVLLLADIAAGSETPGMINKVLGWRSAKKVEADNLWGEIDASNAKIWELFGKLAQIAKEQPEAYKRDLSSAAASPLSSLQPSSPTLAALHEIFSTTSSLRANLRLMSTLTTAPIEPPPQTELLDTTLACPGAVCAAVPGAGGMDAIFAVVIGESAAEKVQETWEKRGNVCGMVTREGKQGARREQVGEVKGLLKVLQSC